MYIKWLFVVDTFDNDSIQASGSCSGQEKPKRQRNNSFNVRRGSHRFILFAPSLPQLHNMMHDPMYKTRRIHEHIHINMPLTIVI